jgi:hypothetical protein
MDQNGSRMTAEKVNLFGLFVRFAPVRLRTLKFYASATFASG